MRVIPVIDIMEGVAVSAKKGERKSYQPLESILCETSNPLDVAKSYERFGFDEIYIADLDAIMKSKPNYNILSDIASLTSLNLIVDAGVDDLQKANHLIEIGVDQVIFPTECNKSLKILKDAQAALKREQIVLSVDIKDGIVLSPDSSISDTLPKKLLADYGSLVGEIIVIDLSSVGTASGPNRELVACLSGQSIIYGGGIRNADDILYLKDVVAGVLVGTALHTGKIKRDEIEKIQENS